MVNKFYGLQCKMVFDDEQQSCSITFDAVTDNNNKNQSQMNVCLAHSWTAVASATSRAIAAY